MSLRVHRRLGVLTDIIDLAEYIAKDNVHAALRFVEKVHGTIEGLAEMPRKGACRSRLSGNACESDLTIIPEFLKRITRNPDARNCCHATH